MNAPDTDRAQPLIAHLTELRQRLIRCLLVTGLVFAALVGFANPLFETLAKPLQQWLPVDSRMIATEVTAPFLVPFKLALMVALVATMPFVLYQLWAFVAPGLYRKERHLLVPLLASSVVLFYAGLAFAYFVVCPLVFGFFTRAGPDSVQVMTDIGRYLDFVLVLFLAFGLAFEIPIATVLLVRSGVVTPEALARKRPYVILGCFVVGMLLTPPDVISQSLLALPTWGLFEIGLLFSRWLPRTGGRAED